MKSKLLFLICPLAVSLALAATTADLPFGLWTRAANEPILSPQGTTWESAGAFNPAVVFHNGKFVMLYRAQDATGTSRLGYAESPDGLHFTRRPDPVLSPEADYEKDGGVEDPRLQKFGDTWYLTYTGYNKKDAQLCLATSRDLIHWERKGVILPAYKGNWNKGWTKSVAVFDRHDPRKLLFRSDAPIFAPEKSWEKVGQVPNVVFVEGLVLKDNRFFFYYGGADKYVGVAMSPRVTHGTIVTH